MASSGKNEDAPEIGKRKTVLITGCSEGGIGSALALAFHHRGCRVFATARNLLKVKHLKEVGIEVLEMDVLDEKSCKLAAAWVGEMAGGALDFLVNNSGIGYNMPFLDADIGEVKRVYETNVVGIVIAVQAFAPLLMVAKGGGTIINIGSIAGIAPVPWQSVYNSSKAAVNHLTDTLRLEMEPLGVKVILALTGGVRTKLLQNMQTRSLPPNSVYIPAKQLIDPALFGKGMEDRATDVEVYAEEFVRNALRGRPSVRYWSGVDSWRVWAVDRLLGGGVVWDLIFRKRAGLVAVKKLLAGSETRK